MEVNQERDIKASRVKALIKCKTVNLFQFEFIIDF
jgi:hypothetical protein